MAASNGNDGNSGTQQAPFKTLERGFSVLLPGDRLFVRSGTYLGFHSTLKIPSGNSWSQPVTIKAYQQENVVLTAPSFKTPLQFSNERRYIIVDGFTIDARNGNSGIGTGFNSHHIRILNGEVKNAPQTAVSLASGSNAFEFINLQVHDNGRDEFDHGFYITTSNNLVKDCLIYGNTGRGIQIYSGSGQKPSSNIIESNKIYGNARSGRGTGIGIFSGTGNAAINNIIWGHNKTGIEVGYGAVGSKVYNNVVYQEVYGMYLDNNSGALIFNNILSSSLSYGLVIKSKSTNAQIKNNLVYGSGTGRDILNQAAATILSKNLEGNIYNPKFQNPSSLNFHLQSGSPAINAGLNLSEVAKDFDNISRPQGSSHDIGAYER